MGYNRINVNTVYQKVQALANKEQRGYITPKNFNLFASQAQQEIFDNYFYDLRTAQLKSKNDTVYADEIEVLESRISMHLHTTTIYHSAHFHSLPGNLYHISSLVLYNADLAKNVYVERVDDNKLREILMNPLTAPTAQRPVYVEQNGQVRVYPSTSQDIDLTYTTPPHHANWAYVVVDGQPMYNSHQSVDFDLHISEENNLVMRILQLAGIAIKDVELLSVAAQDAANTDVKKNN